VGSGSWRCASVEALGFEDGNLDGNCNGEEGGGDEDEYGDEPSVGELQVAAGEEPPPEDVPDERCEDSAGHCVERPGGRDPERQQPRDGAVSHQGDDHDG